MVLENGKEYLFKADKRKNTGTKPFKGKYVVDIPMGLEICEVTDEHGNQYNWSENCVPVVEFEPGQTIELCVKFKIVDYCKVECPIIIKGHYQYYSCDCNGKKSSELQTMVLPCISCKEVRKCLGDNCYDKYTWCSENSVLVAENAIKITNKKGGEVQPDSIRIYIEGVRNVNFDITETPDNCYVVTFWKLNPDGEKEPSMLGSEADPCKVLADYKIKKRICPEDFCYEETTTKTHFVELSGQDKVIIPIEDGCDIVWVSVTIEGVRTEEFILNNNEITLDHSIGTVEDPCKTVIDYEVSKIKCLEDECDCDALVIEENEEDTQSPVLDLISSPTYLKVCKEGHKEVIFEVCKTNLGIQYRGDGVVITGTIEDLWAAGYTESCDEDLKKDKLEALSTMLVDSTKQVIMFNEQDADAIEIDYTDKGNCNYVRVTFLCPDDETAGCILLKPTTPLRSIKLPLSLIHI